MVFLKFKEHHIRADNIYQFDLTLFKDKSTSFKTYNPFLLNCGETAFFNLTGSVILSLSVSLKGGNFFRVSNSAKI